MKLTLNSSSFYSKPNNDIGFIFGEMHFSGITDENIRYGVHRENKKHPQGKAGHFSILLNHLITHERK